MKKVAIKLKGLIIRPLNYLLLNYIYENRIFQNGTQNLLRKR